MYLVAAEPGYLERFLNVAETYAPEQAAAMKAEAMAKAEAGAWEYALAKLEEARTNPVVWLIVGSLLLVLLGQASCRVSR